MCLNVNGSLVDKLESENGLYQCAQEYDCVFISEAWTNESSNVDMNGFRSFCKHRKRKRTAKRDSGGIVVYFREDIAKGVHEEEWDNEDAMCFRLDRQVFGWSEDMFLLCVYMRPSTSTREGMNLDMNCYDLLEEQLAKVSERGGVIVMGDMNGRTGEKQECVIVNECCERGIDVSEINHVPVDPMICVDDLVNNGMSVSRVNSDKSTNDYGNRLINVTTAADLIFLNGRAFSDKGLGRKTFFNHRGESAIDYVICNKYALNEIVDFKVHDANVFSDHAIVSFSMSTSLKCDHENVCKGVGRYAKWNKDKKGDYVTNIGSPEVSNRVRDLSELLVNNRDTAVLERSVVELSEVLVSAGEGHVHTVRTGSGGIRKKRASAAWYDTACEQQRKAFEECERKYHDDQTEESRIGMCMQRNMYRKLCRSKRREHKRAESVRLTELSRRDPKAFWKEIRPKKVDAGVPDCDFFNHFKNLAGRETYLNEVGRREIEVCIQDRQEKYIEQLDTPVTMRELDDSIKGLKLEKASGFDMILNEFLVNASYGVKVLILMIFNNILQLEYFPECWAQGDVIPIFKNGDKNNANNYRGITLLSCMGKLFTRIMNTRMSKWVEDNRVLNETQFGFRVGKGTRDCLFVLHGLIEMLIAKGMKLYCCFIDYEKAYDYLDRAAIWTKLLKTGISSKSIRMFQNMYSKMKLAVRGDNSQRFFSSRCGLLQGESTSPLFFSLFVNDLDEYLNDEEVGIRVWDVLVKVLKFADDMAIFSKTREGLQSGLNSLGEYCQKWGITVNVPKTKIVVFRQGGQLSKYDKWTLLGQNIEVVSFFKYLGCFLTSGGSFIKCIYELTSSARRAMFALRKCFANNPEFVPSMQIKLFNTIVSPILFYACEVWGLRAADPIEVFHRGFLKSVLRVKDSTPDCFVYGELGIFPLYIERYTRVMSYWVNIINTDNADRSLVVRIYKELFQLTLTHPDKVTWASRVRDVLMKCGMGNFWITQRVTDKQHFLASFKRRLQDIYLQGWWENVEKTSSGRLFRYIKTDFVYEPYLDILDRNLRIALTKVRLSSHAFNIERGRWEKVDRENRLCDLCGIVEPEYHCLIECPRFVNEREGLLNATLIDCPGMNAFVRMFKSVKEDDMRNLGLLCFKVLIEYKTHVYV